MIEFDYRGEDLSLTKVLGRQYHLSYGVIQSLFRKKDIRVNDLRMAEDKIVRSGDHILVYYTVLEEAIEILWDQYDIVVVNKPQGLAVEGESSLTTRLSKQLGTPVFPCHRLDMNTKGLVVFARSKRAHEEMLETIQARKLNKYYLTYVQGHFAQKVGELSDFLFKDSKKGIVYIYPNSRVGCVEVITRYRVLKEEAAMSLLEVELVTGRTHQIRAHFAYAGHPVLGDGKYGDYAFNKAYKMKSQVLVAYRVVFHFEPDAYLHELNGVEIQLPHTSLEELL